MTTTHGTDDQDFERQLEAMLAVEPSSRFLPAVRRRVETDRRRRERSWTWWIAGVAAGVPAGAALVLVLAQPPREAPLNLLSSRSGPAVTALPASVDPGVRIATASDAASTRRPPVSLADTPVAGAGAPGDGPHVLVARDEAAALMRLFEAISAGELEPAALPDFGAAPMPLSPIEEIAVEPLELGPLARLEGLR